MHFAGQHSAFFLPPSALQTAVRIHMQAQEELYDVERGERANGFWEKEEGGVRILPPHLSRSHSSCCKICSMWCSVPDFCYAFFFFFQRRHILMIPFLHG